MIRFSLLVYVVCVGGVYVCIWYVIQSTINQQ